MNTKYRYIVTSVIVGLTIVVSKLSQAKDWEVDNIALGLSVSEVNSRVCIIRRNDNYVADGIDYNKCDGLDRFTFDPDEDRLLNFHTTKTVDYAVDMENVEKEIVEKYGTPAVSKTTKSKFRTTQAYCFGECESVSIFEREGDGGLILSVSVTVTSSAEFTEYYATAINLKEMREMRERLVADNVKPKNQPEASFEELALAKTETALPDWLPLSNGWMKQEGEFEGEPYIAFQILGEPTLLLVGEPKKQQCLTLISIVFALNDESESIGDVDSFSCRISTDNRLEMDTKCRHRIDEYTSNIEYAVKSKDESDILLDAIARDNEIAFKVGHNVFRQSLKGSADIVKILNESCGLTDKNQSSRKITEQANDDDLVADEGSVTDEDELTDGWVRTIKLRGAVHVFEHRNGNSVLSFTFLRSDERGCELDMWLTFGPDSAYPTEDFRCDISTDSILDMSGRRCSTSSSEQSLSFSYSVKEKDEALLIMAAVENDKEFTWRYELERSEIHSLRGGGNAVSQMKKYCEW